MRTSIYQSRWALETVLGEKDEFDLVGAMEGAQSLTAFGENQTADLYLIDRQLPGSPIDEIILSLHALVPRHFVIIMSSASEYSGMMLKVSADAFNSKIDQPAWLIETLHKLEKRMRE